MGKKILDSKILYVVLSILVSLCLWVWVTSRDENKESQHFSNLPVALEGEELLAERGLMIVTQNPTASITVRAAPMILATLKNDPPRLTARVSNINSEGTHTVNYTVAPPSGVSLSDVEFIYSGSGGTAVNIDVARALRREVEIRGEFQGSVAEGYLAGDKDDFRFSPEKLTISGQAELVNQVAYAKVIVPGENLTEPVSGEFPFQLIGASGDPLENLKVTCDVNTISASFPIRATADIPLEVKVLEGGGLSRDDVRIRLSTDSIAVAGSREAVDALANDGAITLATINLAALSDEIVENGGEVTFPIPLTDQLENLSGITEVTVSLKVLKRVETREFEVVSRISSINTPEGWNADIITQLVKVRVRGTAELLDELDEADIRVVANLKDQNQAAGRYTVNASVYLDSVPAGTELGVVNPEGYTVVVALSRAG